MGAGGDDERSGRSPATVNTMPLIQPKATAAVSSGVNSVFIGRARHLRVRRGLGVEVDDQTEDQDDQPEQRAEHDELAHDPSDITDRNSAHYYKSSVKAGLS